MWAIGDIRRVHADLYRPLAVGLETAATEIQEASQLHQTNLQDISCRMPSRCLASSLEKSLLSSGMMWAEHMQQMQVGPPGQ